MAKALKGKVAIVTGATSGIGKSILEEFVAAGAQVVAVARSEEALQDLRKTHGKAVVPLAMDMLDPVAAASLAQEALKKVKKIDILVANAGAYLGGDVINNTPEDIARVAQLNYIAPMLNTRSVLPHMVERGSGDIVFLTSLAGHYPTPWEPVYASSKRGAVEFLKIARQQVCESGIRMMEVAPGPTETPLTKTWPQDMLAKAREVKAILDSKVVAQQVVHAVAQPPEVTLRDIVLMPTKFKL